MLSVCDWLNNLGERVMAKLNPEDANKYVSISFKW